VIDSKALLADLQERVKRLTDDLRERCQEPPALEVPLREEFAKAKERDRTAQPYEPWREDLLTQIAVAWVLACVFVRFLEDNELVGEPRLAGSGPRLALARDHEEHFFQENPKETVREYLLAVFADTARLPALGSLFDPQHNPLFLLGPSADAARELLDFWRRTDPSREGVVLVHDFHDPSWSTRFLGDLYQDLSEEAKSRYALLQTPVFVEEFLLDRTLEPAIQEFGFREVRLIDPACGSGHFLLGAFERLFARYAKAEPAIEPRVLAQRALDQIAGVDLNPYAVAIARFRLLLAALRVCRITRLSDAPDFRLHIAAGDSLLHGARPHDESRIQRDFLDDPLKHHHYAIEDAAEVERLLSQRYHVVVGNPPYITPRDRALNKLYRDRFASCHGKYSLAVPFTERFFDLAVAPALSATTPAGFVGMITATSFMKREFGKKLVEEYVPRWDLTHVIDTSGAYVPGHGTPTVILVARCRRPVGSSIRAVMGIRGEPSSPENPAKGKVWSSIVELVDRPGTQSDFVSVADVPRERFEKHPWSIGGGGAAELKEQLEECAGVALGDLAEAIGITSVTGEDDLYMLPDFRSAQRLGIESVRQLLTGDRIRDWTHGEPDVAIWLYENNVKLLPLSDFPHTSQLLWRCKAFLSRRKRFGTPMLERGLAWYEWQELYADKLRTLFSIAFAFVATHNHFVLDRGGKVFKQSAPVIKLPAGASEAEHLGLLGLLNSSTACFWMKQVFYPKATISGDISIEKGKPESNRYEFAGTGLLSFPVPGSEADRDVVATLATELDRLARERSEIEPVRIVERVASDVDAKALKALLNDGAVRSRAMRRRMVALQEELDWECYHLFGLSNSGADSDVVSDPSVGLEPGERPFAWEDEKAPPTLSSEVRPLYEHRRELVQANATLTLIETPVFKRLWLGQQGVFGHASATYEERALEALRGWLCDRLEDRRFWPDPRLVSAARLADAVRSDPEFLQVAELYRGSADFDLTKLVVELVEDEGVPFLPVLRYKPPGLRKRALWERTWDEQRQEDEIDARGLSETEARATKAREVGTIEVPPKYTSADFLKASFWRLRGKLDVPKERFVLYPHAERDADPTPVLTWAGFDALQQAQALAAHALAMKEEEGWPPERLTPLLAGLLELLPWLRQWHNELDPASGQRLGDYFARFLDEECRGLGLTLEDLRAWQPPRRSTRRSRGGRSA